MLYSDILKPFAADIYYATCIDIECYNQRRCDDIKLEKNLGTKCWYRRVNISIFCVSIFYTYNVATQSLEYEETYHGLFCDLDEEVINNNLDSRPTIPP